MTMGDNMGLHRVLKRRDLVCNLTGNKILLRYEINKIQRTRNILLRSKKQYYKLYGKSHQSCTICTSMLLCGRIGDEILRKGQKHIEGEMMDIQWPMKYMESTPMSLALPYAHRPPIFAFLTLPFEPDCTTVTTI